jgi:RNA polymerase sigma-70 factor, ECF subfamily
VQEAWLRLERADDEAIENLDAWLTTVVGRLALDRLRSARARRETYVGPWLPEPLVSDDPADRVTLDESVSYALLTVLEQLSSRASTRSATRRSCGACERPASPPDRRRYATASMFRRT